MCYYLNMTRIGIRELRQNASHYLDKVKSGEVVEVTDRGKLVALLVPPSPAVASRDRLIAAGRLIPARGALQIPTNRHVVRTGQSSSQVLTELRDDRFT